MKKISIYSVTTLVFALFAADAFGMAGIPPDLLNAYPAPASPTADPATATPEQKQADVCENLIQVFRTSIHCNPVLLTPASKCTLTNIGDTRFHIALDLAAENSAQCWLPVGETPVVANVHLDFVVKSVIECNFVTTPDGAYAMRCLYLSDYNHYATVSGDGGVGGVYRPCSVDSCVWTDQPYGNAFAQKFLGRAEMIMDIYF